MLYLDDHFPEHPKVASAGGDAAWLWISAACWVKRHKAGGRIPRAVLPQLTDRRAPLKLAARLVDVGLWYEDGADFVFHEWQVHNWSETRAKKAAHARWGNTGDDAQASASTMLDERSADAPAGGQARAPRPHPPTARGSSSTHDGGVAGGGDDDEGWSEGFPAVGQRALAVLAERALEERKDPRVVAKNGPVGSDAAWLAETARERRRRYGARIVDLLAEHPTMTADELADVLEPPSGPPVEAAEEASVRARRERDELLAARDERPCPDCDAGFREVAGGVVPCESCSATGVAGGVGARV